MLHVKFSKYRVIVYFHMCCPISAHFLGSSIPSQLGAWPPDPSESSSLRCLYLLVTIASEPFNPFQIISNQEGASGLIFDFLNLTLGPFVTKFLLRAFFDTVPIEL